jgi:hypothetical protein
MSKSKGLLNVMQQGYFFYGEMLAPYSTPQAGWPPPCGLSAAAYSLYSELPSIAIGGPSILNPRMCHAVVLRDPPSVVMTGCNFLSIAI